MKPPVVGYARAGSSREAIALLQEHGDEAKLLAGGQSLIPLLSFRLASPSVLVDLNYAIGLDGIDQDNGHLVIGAMARQRTVEISPLVRDTVPLLSEALRHVGHVAIRNRGTIGGSLVHANPDAELPVAVLALDGELIVDGPDSERILKAQDFFLGPFTTVLNYDEILTSIRIPRPVSGTAAAVAESARRSGDFATVVAMAVIRLDTEGRCEDARIAIGGAQSKPARLSDAESILVGAEPSDDAVKEAANTAARTVCPIDDIHAPAEYRRHMTGVFVQRALTEAINRAKEGAA